MSENRIKLVKLFSIASAGVCFKGAIADDEIDEFMNAPFSQAIEKMAQDADTENITTFGEFVDMLLEKLNELYE